MSVSSMTRTKDNKAIYVLFTDEDKSAEFAIPDCRLIKNAGFSQEEIDRLLDYIRNEQDTILTLAKSINPLKAFMESKDPK